MTIRRLTRSRADAKVAGVCAGLANYLDVDVTLVRAAWVVLSIVPGAVVGGLLAYLAAWLIVPEGAAEPAVADHRLTRSSTDNVDDDDDPDNSDDETDTRSQTTGSVTNYSGHRDSYSDELPADL